MQVGPFVPQKGHGLHAVPSHVYMDSSVGVAEGLLRQPDVPGTVFHQKNIDTFSIYGHHVFNSLSAKAKRKVVPCPGCDSTEILPPCRSTIFLQMANPLQVTGSSSRLWQLGTL